MLGFFGCVLAVWFGSVPYRIVFESNNSLALQGTLIYSYSSVVSCLVGIVSVVSCFSALRENLVCFIILLVVGCKQRALEKYRAKRKKEDSRR